MSILVLHGGGSSANALAYSPGMQQLRQRLPGFSFRFVNSPLPGGVWWEDPPSKDNPTLSREHARASIEHLDKIIQNEGPFYGILGYSQGAAMATVYLSQTRNRFQKVLLFNGYLPSVHHGLMHRIQIAAPFREDTMIFRATNDISFYPLSSALIDSFSRPTVITSTIAGHSLPTQDDPSFSKVIDFLQKEVSGGETISVIEAANGRNDDNKQHNENDRHSKHNEMHFNGVNIHNDAASNVMVS